MNPRLKHIIKNKLYEDLSSVSIINYNGSIWFIDPKSKYWYLELYKKTKTLWWRLDFFEDFFILFGMEQREFVPIIIEWVEEVLNDEVISTSMCGAASKRRVEEALNGEIGSTNPSDFPFDRQVEEALNDVVVSTQGTPGSFRMEVEEVLAVSTYDSQLVDSILREKVLKAESVSTQRQKWRQENQVEEILNTRGFSHDFVQEAIVQELFKNMIDKTSPDSDPDYPRIEDVISHHNSSIRG